MSVKNLTRCKTDYVLDNRNYHILSTFKEPYWDEGIHFHKPKGQRNKYSIKWKKREIEEWKVRMYKTWKHNRDHQWKN